MQIENTIYYYIYTHFIWISICIIVNIMANSSGHWGRYQKVIHSNMIHISDMLIIMIIITLINCSCWLLFDWKVLSMWNIIRQNIIIAQCIILYINDNEIRRISRIENIWMYFDILRYANSIHEQICAFMPLNELISQLCMGLKFIALFNFHRTYLYENIIFS